MNGVLIDANLLCLLVAGAVDPNIIATHKRLRAYAAADHAAVLEIVNIFGPPILCSAVIAETSNLLRYDKRRASSLSIGLATLVGTLEEQSKAARAAVSLPEYSRLGFTDAIFILLSESAGTLLSDDLALCQAVEARGQRAINYNHVRSGALTTEDLRNWLLSQ